MTTDSEKMAMDYAEAAARRRSPGLAGRRSSRTPIPGGGRRREGASGLETLRRTPTETTCHRKEED